MANELAEVYDQCRALLASQAGPNLVVLKDEPDAFHLYVKGDFEFGKRRMSELFLAGVQRNKSSVVLHYMPLYMNEPLKAKLEPSLLKKLKGKTCFHLSSWDAQTEAAILDALEKGLASYGTFGTFA